MNEIVSYKSDGGADIELSPAIIRNVLTSGHGNNVTDAEVMMFLELCRGQRLNPFLGEVHLIKYGNSPATMVTGKDIHTKRAYRNPRFRGMQAGISVINTLTGEYAQHQGSCLRPNEQLWGGWCKVFVDGCETPFYDEVSLSEYVGRKGNGEITNIWLNKQCTMIRKVAMVHALREAFPEDLQGLYDAAEMGVEEPEPIQAEVYQQDEPISVGEF